MYACSNLAFFTFTISKELKGTITVREHGFLSYTKH